jgi:hypothetical protein
MEKSIIIHIPYNSLAGFQKKDRLTDQTLLFTVLPKTFWLYVPVAAIDLPLWLFYGLEYREHFSACEIGKVKCFVILTRHYKFLASVCILRF